jgi:hypothetical protein
MASSKTSKASFGGSELNPINLRLTVSGGFGSGQLPFATIGSFAYNSNRAERLWKTVYEGALEETPLTSSEIKE